MYLILPLCALVYALDVVVFDHHLLRVLPKSPRSYFLLSILFGTPHIVASNLIFLITGCEFSGEQKLLTFALVYAQSERRVRCPQKNVWHAGATSTTQYA